MHRRIFLTISLIFVVAVARAGNEPPEGAWVYEMKEDPTLPLFVNDLRATGFYALALDEERGIAWVLFRDADDNHFSVDVDMKLKGKQLTLINGKRRKSYIWDRETQPSGEKQNVVYPVEYPPEKAGWRHGPSFARRFVRRGDDMGMRMVTGEAKMEFRRELERCERLKDDCGPTGLGPWDVAATTASNLTANAAPVSVAKPAAPRLPFARAILDAKLGEPETLSVYRADIDAVLPPTFRDLNVQSTYFHTTPLPYPGMTDPMIQQRGLRIGVIGKRYLPQDNPASITIEIEPLMPEFQGSAPNHCGSWISDPSKMMFDVRGHPAMYAATPFNGTGQGSSIVICAETYSLSMETAFVRPKDYFLMVFEALPLDDIDRTVGIHAP